MNTQENIAVDLKIIQTECLVLVRKRRRAQENLKLEGPMQDLKLLLDATQKLSDPKLVDRNTCFLDAVILYKQMLQKYQYNQSILQTLNAIKITMNQVYKLQESYNEMKRKSKSQESYNQRILFGTDNNNFKL